MNSYRKVSFIIRDWAGEAPVEKEGIFHEYSDLCAIVEDKEGKVYAVSLPDITFLIPNKC